MGEMKHTPGPWAVTEPFRVVHGIPVCEVRRPNYAGYVIASTSITDDFSQMTAACNAHLIAAAPDMLEALKRIVNPAPGVSQKAPAWVYGIARAALSKAEGRSLSSASGQEGGE